MQPVTKAVLPAAGLGTRFLPVTKSIPKEMLPLVDTPAIQYRGGGGGARPGSTDILVITGRGKRAIEDHFDRNPELEQSLRALGKDRRRSPSSRPSSRWPTCTSIRQHEALGLGHAVSVAEPHVGGEPFVVMLGDDIMVDDATLLKRMLAVHAETGGSVLALMEVPLDEISAYGSLDRGAGVATASCGPAASSRSRARGRAVEPGGDRAVRVHPGIFDALRETNPGVGGEIQITDAIGILLEARAGVRRGVHVGRYDVGKKIDFLRANIELGLARDDLRHEIEQMLRDLVRDRGLA